MAEIQVTRSDHGRTLDVRQGDVIVVRLEENLTTGYGWEVESAEGTVVVLAGSDRVETTGKSLGRSGLRVLRFVARAQGAQQVRLRLRRPWEPADKAIEQFSVAVRVL